MTVVRQDLGQVQPGKVRDAIVRYLRTVDEASVAEIQMAVTTILSRKVPPSSVRSYLRLNEPKMFTRVRRGFYRLNEMEV